MTQPRRLRMSKLTLGLVAALAAAPVFAQSTSSGIGGMVTHNGQPVAGAEVTITHVESGTVSRASTDASGRYNARGLRVGGPYNVTITKPGDGTQTQEGIYLGLDQVASVNAQLTGDVATLESMQVTAARGSEAFTSDNKGISTNLSRGDLDRTPMPDRSIQNVVRSDPRVVVTDRDRGAFSAMGQNNRYNSITVDTISAGDPFGLNDNGLPTKGTPISQDAIESYNISTANFDVATRRGVGAWVNAVTKSGTNDFHGSAYYVYQNADDMIGKGETDAKWTGYTKDTTKGATLGGPILKDKLFFFASYEESKKEAPGAIWGTSDSSAISKVSGVTTAQLQQITTTAQNLGLSPGDDGSASTDIESKRYLAKLDWNISDYHRASLRFSRTEEDEPIITASSSTQLKLSSNWYVLNKTNTSYALSFYDDWSEKFSTEASVGYSKFEQDRAPLVGGYQPEITVRTSGADTGSSVLLGTDYSSQANVLSVKSWNAYFAGSWFLGDHVAKAGIDYQQDEVYNLFLQRYNGTYAFNSIADFASGTYRRYQLSQPAAGYTLDNVAAIFKMKQYGLFLQDTWRATDRLSIQYGLRYDVPKVNPMPTYNPCFAADAGVTGNFGACGLRATPANANASVGGFGFSNTGTIDGNSVLQPRFSFNYDLDTERPTQLRGGAGLFVSNTPAVWVGNPYSNNGVAVTTYDVNRRKTAADPAFSADPFGQNVPGGTVTPPGLGSSSMTVNVVDPNFKLPAVYKYTLGLDHQLPWQDLVFTAEYQHLDVDKGILYQDMNMGAPTGTLPDGRYTYARFPNQAPGSTNTANWNKNASFSNVIYLTNTDKGKSDNFTVSLKKPFDGTWSAMLAYTYSRATEVNPGTSSVAYSSYQNRAWYNPSDDAAGISNYSIPNRIIAQLSWEHKFFGDYATRVSAFYDGHNGAPYSWVFGNDAQGLGLSSGRSLAYVPSGPNDVVWANATSQQLSSSFWEYIGKHPELARYKGDVAERNSSRAPWVNQLDMSFSQEIPGFAKGHKGEIRLDMFNVLNMLNKDWGVEHRADFPLVRNLANVAGVTADGKYIYDISSTSLYNRNGTYAPTDLAINETQNPSQRWSLLLTLRYTF
ncbi:carboxypeptidase regulatory-like domain-containing protein [Xanthomonas translucens pv. translucens]|uniref:TonB-dependent receptor n=2 Tax=Xanthomonas campestris pv. translucens TaxID=343 RepID=UPI00071E8704|nr:TonB-dependent receptor [Xanthomonas translucens]UKE56920.1 carboxypeptidase regulatory-like domain-containing protein [Xanthomonas translucens pv. hordei]KWV15289.1 Oar protein [Xanthomonas translucens]MCS3359333.1 carboxypeptidase regulatory-like domain-containing protein [Xanthomonas translucens pv. translucens]MCT8312737.1 carboxypeptidase regulatory-like domain-containing protein [Xanthomonas translucens pv. translucens]MQS41271.1 Oar protein [Xanthomonas translucens pv. translucens]